MNDSVTLKKVWDQSVNYMQKLKNLYHKFRGSDLKILVFPALLIYWAIIILAPFSL